MRSEHTAELSVTIDSAVWLSVVPIIVLGIAVWRARIAGV